jgi:tyrosyl-DNA phosphodiesterase 2
MIKPDRLNRALSAFDPARSRWAAIPLRPHAPSTQGPSSSSSRPAADRRAIGKQLCLTSWNIQASRSKLVERSELILDHILKGPKSSDIIFLQEVAPSVRRFLLADPRVLSSFLTTDAEDDTAFKGVPVATMTLLSKERFVSPLLLTEKGEGEGEGKGEGEGGSVMVLDSVFRMTLPSRYGRDALCVDIRDPAAPGAVLRLLNVHLDSLDSWLRRAFQMLSLDGLLREDRCSGGVIAGDFNAIHAHDDTLVDEHGLVDAWVALPRSRMGPDGGATWGVGVEREDGRKPRRLDKVVMLGLEPVEIEVLRPGFIDAGTPWSDHCGLRCTFNV